MWRYPVFAFICYVSIHLEIFATVVLSAPEKLPIRIRTTNFRGCGMGQGSGMVPGIAGVPRLRRRVWGARHRRAKQLSMRTILGFTCGPRCCVQARLWHSRCLPEVKFDAGDEKWKLD
jgi:hypothetical protein